MDYDKIREDMKTAQPAISRRVGIMLDDLEGHEAECLAAFEDDIDLAFAAATSSAIDLMVNDDGSHPLVKAVDALIEATMPLCRSPEAIAQNADAIFNRGSRLTLDQLHEEVVRERPVSIPDKLYAKARAEGYEAGMADAAKIASEYLVSADAAVMRGLLLYPINRAMALSGNRGDE